MEILFKVVELSLIEHLQLRKLANDCNLVIVLDSSLSYLNTANNNLKFGGKIYCFIKQEPYETTYDISYIRSDVSLATKALINLIINIKIPPKRYACPSQLIKNK